MTDERQTKLTLKEKLGYGCGGVTDGANYTFMGSYMLFFLTTVAHVDPAAAGTLVAAGSIISALWNPLVGFLSDRTVSRFGKRRPFLIAASLPLALAMVLCFTRIEAPDVLRNIYYGFAIVLFWCSFSTFYGPWLALGADYTAEYSERTELRTLTYGITLTGNALSLGVPPLLVDWFASQGMSQARAWQLMAVIVALITFCALWMTILAARSRDLPRRKIATQTGGAAGVKALCCDYLDILRLRPTKFVLGACLCHITATGIFSSDRLYFFTYNLQLSPLATTLVMLSFPLAGVIVLRPILTLSKWLDKRKALIFFLLTASAGCLLIGELIGVRGFWSMVALTFVFVIGNSAFWQLMPVMIYDISEYDEYKNGKRREGIIVSLQTVMETICSGTATMLLGFILQLAGFDETQAVQTDGALAGVSFAICALPAILMLGCAFMVYKYPITKQVFNDIKAAIKSRKNTDNQKML